MSVGNTKTNGNKGNNFPYQHAVLELLGQINSSINALPGVDYETRTTTYQATAAGPGYSIGDIIVRYDIIDVATSTVVSTLWFNQTTQSVIAALGPKATTADITALAALVATEATLAAFSAKYTSVSRTPSVVNVPASSAGSTTAGVQELSILVIGGGNTVGGVSIPSGTILNYKAKAGDTIGALAYTTGAGANRLILTYLT